MLLLQVILRWRTMVGIDHRIDDATLSRGRMDRPSDGGRTPLAPAPTGSQAWPVVRCRGLSDRSRSGPEDPERATPGAAGRTITSGRSGGPRLFARPRFRAQRAGQSAADPVLSVRAICAARVR